MIVVVAENGEEKTRPHDGTNTTISASHTSDSDATKITGVSITNSYTYSITVTDKLGNSTTRSIVVPTEAVVLDIRKTGKLAIGKYWENGALDVNGQIHSNDSIYLTKASAGRISIRNAATSPTINFGLHLGSTADHGLYDFVAGKWMIYADSNGDVKLDGGKTPYYTTDTTLVKTSGAQTIAGNKTFNAASYITSSSGIYGANDPILYFLRSNSNDLSERLGCVFANVKTVNDKHVMNRMYFREYSCDDTGNAIQVWDQYMLPTVAQNQASSKTYDILTSKAAVTIAQGGTGATTVAEAKSNLGIRFATLYDSAITSGTGTLGETAANFDLLIVQGTNGETGTSFISTISVNGQRANLVWTGSAYLEYTISGATITIHNASSGRYLRRVYGLKIG